MTEFRCAAACAALLWFAAAGTARAQRPHPAPSASAHAPSGAATTPFDPATGLSHAATQASGPPP